jgi:beta-lactamase regulating signal transducer with metallopeptidase domain
MGDLFVYILKSSLCLAVFYLFFMVALSKDTLYRFNRYIIVVLFALSLLLPFINISVGSETPYSGMALNIEALLAMANSNNVVEEAPSATPSVLIWILVIYFIGVITAFGRALISFVQMIKMLRQKDSQKSSLTGGITLIIHDKVQAPFSWMKYIVISDRDYMESGDEIITHELAHIYNRHSLDLIVAEAVKIIHWFNPAAYLLKRELQNIHEYQADEAVIKNGIDAKKYQLLLIKKAVGDRLYSMANSFNHSKLKNRITMISKKKSQKKAALKALLLLPLSMFAIAAFATEEVSAVLAPVSEVKVTDFIQSDTIKTQMKRVVILKEKDDKTDTVKTKKSVKVFVYNNDTLLKEVNEGVKVARFNAKSGDTTNVIVFVDGVQKDKEMINQIDPDDISEVRVLKGEKAIEQYGGIAKDGIIIITTKYSEKRGEDDVKVVEKVVVKMSDTDAKPLYVIDGALQEKVELNDINPKNIESIKVLKGEVALKKFGEKGKNGVILITLKK